MSVSDLEQRRKEILGAVVEAYISTGMPVGSELISRKLRHTLSPATIRNVMANLEEEGLLEHPHTSAGRVPTDRGYRTYVNSLSKEMRLSQMENKQLLDAIHPGDTEPESLLSRVSSALSELSHQAGFVITPTVKGTTIQHIELMPLGVHKVLCVLVGQEPFLASHTIEVEEPITRDEVMSLVHFLNAEFTGLPVTELLALLERRLLAVNDSLYHVVKRSLDILQTALATEPDERLLLEGAAYLFEYPELHPTPQQSSELLRQLELRQELLARFRSDLTASVEAVQTGVTDGAVVRIGREVGIEGLEGCSYVIAPFALGRGAAGGVGVLGPRRMDYRRMRALVEGVAEVVTHLLRPESHGPSR